MALMLQNCGAKIISLPQFQSVPGFNILTWRDSEKIVWENRAGSGESRASYFCLKLFRGVPTIWKPDTLLATTSLDPSRWLRFRMRRHLSSFSGELSGVFVLGSKPPPLTLIAWTGLETRPSTRLTSHFKKDLLLVFLKYKRSLKIIVSWKLNILPEDLAFETCSFKYDVQSRIYSRIMQKPCKLPLVQIYPVFF